MIHHTTLVCCVLAFASVTAANAQTTFTDVRASLGLPGGDGNGSSTFGDYDGDGWLDLMTGNSRTDHSYHLFRNQSGASFVETSQQAGIGSGQTENPIFADYDNDGDEDIYIPSLLFQNQGNGTFVDATSSAGLSNAGYGAVWVDYDRDGYLDLATVHFPRSLFLYHNNGNGTFTPRDAGGTFTIPDTTNYLDYATVSDYDGDGDPDLYLIVYNTQSTPSPNVLLRNDSSGWTDVTITAGVGDPGNSYGGGWFDYDRDGDMDLVVPNVNNSTIRLYRNNSNGTFADVTSVTGLLGPATGAVLGDYDNDGWVDIYAPMLSGQHRLWHNNGDGTFSDLLSQSGLTGPDDTWSAVWADYNRDGRLDVYVPQGNLGDSDYFFRNNGPAGNYLELSLRGVVSNGNGIGAWVTAHVAGARLIRELYQRDSYINCTPPELHFGLGSAAVIDSLVIRWPSGLVQRLMNVSANQYLTVTEQHQEITVSSPNGGETMAMMSDQTISWSSQNLTGDVRIELNRAYPSGSWETLLLSTPNDGSESWLVAGPASNACRLRISSVNDSNINDVSDADFTIYSLPPDPITDLTAQFDPSFFGIALHWSPRARAEWYEIYCSSTDDTDFPSGYYFLGTSTDTLYVDFGSTNNFQSRYYLVTARGEIESGPSNKVGFIKLTVPLDTLRFGLPFKFWHIGAGGIPMHGVESTKPSDIIGSQTKCGSYPFADLIVRQDNNQTAYRQSGSCTWAGSLETNSTMLPGRAYWYINRSGYERKLILVGEVNHLGNYATITISAPAQGGSAQTHYSWQDSRSLNPDNLNLLTSGFLGGTSQSSSDQIVEQGTGLLFWRQTNDNTWQGGLTATTPGRAYDIVNVHAGHTWTYNYGGDCPRPMPPSNLQASDTSCAGVFLTWADVSLETGYTILRDTSEVGTTSADVTSFIDTSVTPNQTHSYSVKAYNDCGSSTASNTDQGIRPCTPPQLIEPNGGEVWHMQAVDTIRWSVQNATGNVNIKLNRNYPGGNWETLFAATPNDSIEVWVVTGPASNTCRIRVSSVSDSGINDVSDADFAIRGTVVCDTVAGVWDSTGSPYYVNCNIIVPAGQTLEIGPGVVVQFMGAYSLTINGVLLAEGTESDSIRFTTDTLANPGRWRGLRFLSNSTQSHLDYCVIEHGSQPAANGGGIYCSGSPQFVNCTIRHNQAMGEQGRGGGIHLTSGSNASFTNCLISENQAWRGGGVYIEVAGAPAFAGCVFTDNFSEQGGAIYGSSCAASFVKCLFAQNSSAPYAGGALYWEGSGNPSVAQCTFVKNAAPVGGAAIEAFQSSLVVNSCIVAYSTGAGIVLDQGGEVRYSDIYGNSGGDYYGGLNNIQVNPLFADTSIGDYHLTVNSPCIDTGDPALSHDPDSTVADMGAFYYHHDLPLALTLLSPNGGENWMVGDTHFVFWSSQPPVGHVRIDLDRNYPNGGWETIAASTPNTGSYPWRVSPPAVPFAGIRITLVESPQVGDTSMASFTIESPPPNLLPGMVSHPFPENGSTRAVLQPFFSWFPADSAMSYDLYLWPDTSSVPATPLAGNLLNTFYQLTSNLSYGQRYYWRVDARNFYGTTPGPVWSFTVRALPDLTVSEIQAPEQVYTEQTYQVTWFVQNAGAGSTIEPIWYDGLYLSPEPVYNAQQATFLGQFENAAALAPGESYANTATFVIPRNTIPGDYYIFVRADHGGQVLESNEGNNLVRTLDSMEVLLTPPPDLRVDWIQTPSSTFSGSQISVTWAVQNHGVGSTVVGSWSDALYLSTDSLYSGNDQLLTTVSHTGVLWPESTYTATTTVTLPQAISGTRYIIVWTDVLNQVYEVAAESNTRSSDSVHVYLSPPPDLIVSDIIVPPNGTAGQNINLSYIIRNQGAGAPFENTWNDRVYLSTRPFFVPDSAFVLGTFTRSGTLAPNGSYSRTAAVSLPNGLVGPYFVYVWTDYANQVFEYLADTNNVTRSPATMQVNLPPWADLVVTAIVVPVSGNSGQPLNIEWTVENLGTAGTPVSAWLDQVYLSATYPFNPDSSALLGALSHSGTLQPGAAYTVQRNVTLPDGISGPYYLYVETDAMHVVYEYVDDDNNVARSDSAVAVSLTPWADLIVNDVSHPDSAMSGQNVLLEWTVTNQGPGAATDSMWSDRVYLSPNAALDTAAATLLGSYNHAGPLGSDSSYTASFSVPLPHRFAGHFYIHVVADGGDAVYEHGNENNNTASSATGIEIVHEPWPDLTVATLNVPVTGVSGQPMSVEWTVLNQGTGTTAESFWIDRVYLSANAVFDSATAMLLSSANHNGSLSPGASYNRQSNVSIPNGLSGPYYVYVWTDWDNRVYEYSGNGNNTIRSTAIAITISPWPDLRVTAIQCPGQVQAGDSIGLSFTILNDGQATAPAPWTDNIYVSASPSWNPANATLLRGIAHSLALAMDSSYTVTSIVLIPPALTGSHYFYVLTDAGNNVYEYQDEGNNSARSEIVGVEPYPPVDLAVASVMLPDSAWSGQMMQLQWTVTNLGQARTLVSGWDDAAYLSADPVLSPQDIQLCLVTHTGALNAGQSYSRSQAVVLPNGLVGSYYLILKTDVVGLVIDSNPLNNTWVDSPPLVVQLTSPPDLVISNHQTPQEVNAGQPMTVQWTVVNNGIGITPVDSWNDGVYISLNSVLDASDERLATYSHSGNLAPADSYAVSLDMPVPNYMSGNYYIIIKTDTRDDVYEHTGEGNNIIVEPIGISTPPLADLVVTNIALPDSAYPGDMVTVSWTIENHGLNPAIGWIRDAVYFSPDTLWTVNDPMLAFANRYINIPAGGMLSVSSELNLSHTYRFREAGEREGNLDEGEEGDLVDEMPGVPVGQYHAVVRTDLRNSMPETDENNNTSFSTSMMNVVVPSLVLGVPTQGQLSNGQMAYYRLDVAANLDLRITLTSDTSAASNEIYVAYDRVPTLSDYDECGAIPFMPNQELFVPSTQAGTYYVMLLCRNLPTPLAETYTILAEALPFSIVSITPDHGGTPGRVTARTRGAGFRDSTQVFLRISPDSLLPANKITFINTTELKVRWDLTGVPLGTYDLVARGADSIQIEYVRGFTVETSLGILVSEDELSPDEVRTNRSAEFDFVFRNNSNTDIEFFETDIIVPATPRLTAITKSGELLNVYDILQDTVSAEESWYYTMTTDNDSLNVVHLLARDFAPQQVLSIRMRASGFRPGFFPIRTVANGISTQSFVDDLIARIASTREFVSTYPDIFDTAMVALVQDSVAFTREVLQWYVEAGIVDMEATNGPRLKPLSESTAPMEEGTSIVLQAIDRVSSDECQYYGCQTFCSVHHWNCARAVDDWLATHQQEYYFDFFIIQLWEKRPTCLTACMWLCEEWENQSIDWCKRMTAPRDPNEILGPSGYGELRYLSVEQVLPFQISFENDPILATAPAQAVHITEPLDLDLNSNSFRLGSFGFGNFTFEVPPDRAYFTDRLDVRDSLGLYVDVTAGLDVTNNQIFWNFESIDPATGESPTDPFAGFLPINDSLTHRGEGFVSYTILPNAQVSTGAVIDAQARIIFDVNDPVDTEPIFNTIDAGNPTSLVDSLPLYTDTTQFVVRWSGHDDPCGSGLAAYSLYVAVNGGPFELYEIELIDTFLTFTGEMYNYYEFFTIARDNVGRTEPMKTEADAATFLVLPPPSNPVTDLTIRVERVGNDHQATLRWSEVTEDTLGNPITVDEYRVYQRNTLAGGDVWSYLAATPDSFYTVFISDTVTTRFFQVYALTYTQVRFGGSGSSVALPTRPRSSIIKSQSDVGSRNVRAAKKRHQ